MRDYIAEKLESVSAVVNQRYTTYESIKCAGQTVSSEKARFEGAIETINNIQSLYNANKISLKAAAMLHDESVGTLISIANQIGIACESDEITEEEIDDVRDYLDGAENIIDEKADDVDDTPSIEITPAEESAYMADIKYCEAVLEGFNWDKKDMYKKMVDEAVSSMKAAQKQAKAGDVEGAKKNLSVAIAKMEENKKAFDAACAQGGVGDSIIGFFAYQWRMFGRAFLIAFASVGADAVSSKVGFKTPIAKLGGKALEMRSAIDTIATIVQAVNKVRKGEKLSPSDLNKYTKSLSNNMAIMITRMKGVLNKMG